tara:strand:+ start:6892 stop:9249 length:2358 start_codon:yes stop_codon:yes gene_type:complete
MTVFYVDPVGGNDSNNGQSFANRKKWWDEVNLGTGDEIRWIKSPEPTSLGNASWASDSPYNHGDPLDGSRQLTGNFDGQSSGNPTTVADTSHGLSTGDAIFVYDSGLNGYQGVYQITKTDNDNFTLDGTENSADTSNINNITYTNINPFTVRLASSPIKNIICHQGLGGGGDKDWTIDQGTGGRETSNYQSGYKSAKKFKPGNGVSGKVAHVELDSTLDLSGYQQISFKFFWDYISSGQKTDTDVFSIRLCTDTDGDTSVHTVPIKPPCGDRTDRWIWYTHDFGTNLNSSIQSITLYADSAMEHNNNEIQIDNVIACKASSSADSLHLGSVIGKGTTHMSAWYPIMAIVDKIIILDSYWYSHDGLFTEPTPYLGTTETVTTYKRECFSKPEMYDSLEDYGNDTFRLLSEHNITISGGWNSTDMSTQDTNAGTWLAQHSYQYSSMEIRQCNNINISEFGVVRGFRPANYFGSSSLQHQKQSFTNCQFVLQAEDVVTANRTLLDNCRIYGCLEAANLNSTERIYKNCTFDQTSLYPGQGSSLHGRNVFIGCDFKGCGNQVGKLLYTSGLNYYSNPEFHNCSFDKTRMFHHEDWHHNVSLTNCTFGSDFNLFDGTHDVDQGWERDDLPQIAFINYNDTANDHRLYYTHYLVTSDSSVTQSGSGFSWKFDPLSTTQTMRREKSFPLRFKLAEVAVYANAQVTVSVYVRRSGYTNENDDIGLAALLTYNGSIGLTSDAVVYNTTNNSNTWEQLTLTFTPTLAGVARIDALISGEGSTAYKWVDTLSISQA